MLGARLFDLLFIYLSIYLSTEMTIPEKIRLTM